MVEVLKQTEPTRMLVRKSIALKKAQKTGTNMSERSSPQTFQELFITQKAVC